MGRFRLRHHISYHTEHLQKKEGNDGVRERLVMRYLCLLFSFHVLSFTIHVLFSFLFSFLPASLSVNDGSVRDLNEVFPSFC